MYSTWFLLTAAASFPAAAASCSNTQQVQRHLANVYAALAATVLTCAFGAAADLWLHVGGLLTTVAGRWRLFSPWELLFEVCC